ncbi:putative O-methyltransferase [Aspergillus ibericus CBS 121593]|uniref:O-methyltransferase n=1 Tax=Aspergillus ibericus CBS 121593 TaxID=1448316 RepID=A0A395GPP9_9EURO|nr:O-methyltransferase [Aspergillus ibericus CBS 121593]RAK97344.1 O-methyltransferase [Aspergillus ibericus CBS 121593]
MSSVEAGLALGGTVNSVAALGFVPVAIHFRLFDILTRFERPAHSEEVLALYHKDMKSGDHEPCLALVADTLFAMACLGFIDQVDKLYQANAITKHLEATPSALHGALHLTTEVLFASAFLMRKLQADNFKYPFQEKDTPFQYAYQCIGRPDLANQHTYSIMASEGRMDSFNTFMQGKYIKTSSAPERFAALGYDLQSVLNAAGGSVPSTMVDIGGGRGELLLEIKDAFPQLQESDLVVQEFNGDIGDIPGVTLSTWNSKEGNSPQPIKGALVYHLSHVLHNLSDLESARLLQKVAEAMAPYSRLLIHEFAKHADLGNLHPLMIVLHAGRERSQEEWAQLAALAGLRITFEAYPKAGEGLIEMRKI